ncbi:MAG: PAS domain S-box protein [Anaerolineae bacterium]|nr:PAS domain S-box protein [Anaerolineae bacterium]
MTSKAELETRIAELEAAQRRTEAIAEVSAKLSLANNEQEILETIIKSVAEHSPDTAVLEYFEVDESGQPYAVEIAALQDHAGQPVPLDVLPQIYFTIAEFPVFNLIVDAPDRPTFLEDIATDPRCDPGIREFSQTARIAASIAIPIKSGKRWHGLIAVNWFEPRTFDDELRALMNALTPRVADAVAGRRAYLDAQQARRRNETLYQISQGLSAARTEDEMLEVISQTVEGTGKVDIVLYYIDLDQAGEPEWLEVAAVRRSGDAQPGAPGMRFKFSDFPICNLFVNSPEQPVLAGNLATDEHVDAYSRAITTQLGYQALVIIPLTQAGRWVGALDFFWYETRSFGAEELAVYNALPALVAPAVDSRRAYLAVEQAREMSDQFYQTSQQLTTARSESEILSVLMPAFAQADVFLASLFYIDIDIDEAGQPEWAEIVAVWQAEGDPLTPLGTRIHLPDYPFSKLWFADPDHSLLVADMTQDERVDENTRAFYAQAGLQATAIIPLAPGGRWAGSICLSWLEPHQFSEQEKAVYNTLPSLMAPVVENRRLTLGLEQMVEERTAEIRRIYDLSVDMFGTADFNGFFKMLNPAWSKVLGYTLDELYARPFIEFVHPDDIASTNAAAAGLIKGKSAVSFENRYRCQDGSYKWLSWNSIPDIDNDLIYFVVRDITTQKQAEAERQRLLEEMHYLETSVTQAVDGIAIADMDGLFRFVNPAWLEMHGYERADELLGKPLSLNHSEEQLKHDVEPHFARLMQNGADQTEIGHIKKDGTPFPTWMSASLVRDDAGNAVGIVGVARDITEQKRAETESARLQEQIIEAQEQALRELASPIIPVMEGIIVMPLVGSIDTGRARQVTRALLSGISQHRARVAILDVTGVSVVDSGVADHLNKTIMAVRLKGAHTILTGLSDAVAETVVDLGIDWSDIETLRDLQSGLISAMNRLNIRFG